MSNGWRHLDGNEKVGRNLRARKYKREYQVGHQTKRLFTPEIKKFLKAWLVRRRKNPYPNRTEKKELAIKTGLTYIQICNWFANWRRKLKNTCRNSKEGSWGFLIKGYNHQAKGNVEQFSICSDDSIWDETNFSMDDDPNLLGGNESLIDADHCYYSVHYSSRSSNGDEDPPILFTKWLENSATYEKDKQLKRWQGRSVQWEDKKRLFLERRRLEMDAAEALTHLGAWRPQQFSISGH